MKPIKAFILLFACLTLAIKTQAHNAVAYISEEVIFIGGLGLLILLIGLIFSVIGLFKTNRFLRIFSIIAACLGSCITLFLISQSYNSFGNAFMPFLIYSIIIWSAITFRKAHSTAYRTKPLFLGFIEGALILLTGWIITLFSKGYFVDHKPSFLMLIYSSMFFIIFSFHRWFYKKRFQAGLSVALKPGIIASLYSSIICIVLFFMVELLRSFGAGFNVISLNSCLRVICKMLLPQLILGAGVSWLFSSTYLKLRQTED